ncbi:uncharacterized protein F5147DRAFT_681538 [Suillus discolor]|uniref:Uncharacterized protein n=1 Tax=Suillus discolor TaxID=1912936 RepID=A0A9P7FCQ1_9AGAM|nr:uncharacterized protein F5147DRAFT_681538 [Suillus discolor]KAG2113535.1 hypothetical protein F5147DRAFT_681538 [Suillus discolor]
MPAFPWDSWAIHLGVQVWYGNALGDTEVVEIEVTSGQLMLIPITISDVDYWVMIAHNHKWMWMSISSLPKLNSTALEILIGRVTDCILCKGKCIYRRKPLRELTFNTMSYIALVALSTGLTVSSAVPVPFEVGLFSPRSTLHLCLMWSTHPFIH